MLLTCETPSPGYAVIKTAELIQNPAQRLDREFTIPCRLDEAETLLNLARRVLPKAMPNLLRSIARARGAA